MKTVNLTDAQAKWISYWLTCFECPTHCKSGNCSQCRLNQACMDAMYEVLK